MLRSAPTSLSSQPVVIEDVRQLLQQECEFGPAQAAHVIRATNRQYAHLVRQDITALQKSVDAASKTNDNTYAKLGLGLFLLGQADAALPYFEKAPRHLVAVYYHAETLISLDRPAEAEPLFAKASVLGFDPITCELQRVGALRLSKRVDEAEKALKAIAAKAVSRADYSFQFGCILADKGDTFGAIEYFERAVDMDPQHSKALFWLANETARMGNDEDAVVLYERCLSKPPYFVAALLNLGLLYEDLDRPQCAAFCFREVLKSYPSHPRAIQFLKDIDTNESMLIDEASAKEEAKHRQTLARPLSDFEISVRSRNCLVRLNLNSLGDLTKITEAELLASRNFGETSLKELRELMETQNLKIGQYAHSPDKKEQEIVPQDLPPEQRAILEQPISDLNLSVRARKCMSRLNITVIGELVSRTPDELLSTRNFGVTSLNEIRAKLTEFGLSLRND